MITGHNAPVFSRKGLAFKAAACSVLSMLCATPPAPAQAAGAAASISTTGPKPCIVVPNGAGSTSPYLIYGVQLRIDTLLNGNYTLGKSWPMPYAGSDGPDYYFRQAASVNFKTVVVPVPWKFVDSTKTPGANQYNFEYVHRIIDSANAYGLNVQLLWYGSDVCGYEEVPAYIDGNPGTYPRNPAHTQFPDLSSVNLVTAETNALVAMMNEVARYDTNKRVMVVQIENEPDGAGPLASSLHWGDTTDMQGLMYAGGQYAAVSSLVNKLAAAVKKSAWQGVTRVNVGSSYRSIDLVNARAALSSGVDIFGVDLYTSTLSSLHNTLAQAAPPPLFGQLLPAPQIDPLTSSTDGTRANYAANVTHQPEGGGQYGNYISQVLSNFADGGGALIYELRTLQTWQSGGVWQPTYDLGIFRRTTTASGGAGTWTARDGTQNTVPYNPSGNTEPENNTAAITLFNSTIYKADHKIALATPITCAAFNLQGTLGTSGASETETVGNTSVKFQTWSNAQAFALQDTNGDLILLNLTAGNNITLDPAYHYASAGYYDAANVWHTQYAKNFNGNTLLCWGGECIRVTRTP